MDENPLFYVIIDNHIGGVFMKWKVGIYARVSRDSEYSDTDSIDNQLSLVRSYCINNNLDIVETYVDDGYSGTNFYRPGFAKMLNDSRE